MERKEKEIAIIGAGISGLIAAKVLESNGFAPIIYEKSDRAGGRLKTDIVDGYQLDHGFQVLLDAYPLAQSHLDYDALELQKFLPGATLFKNDKQVTLGDPLRNISLLFPTLLSGIGTFSDKWKIFQLNRELKSKSLEHIFEEAEITTLEFLQQKGFSEDIIRDFFRPFFSGIFLEPELSTSSRMFQFVYKMFGTGNATLPKSGIEAIPKQLVSKLKRTKIKYETEIISCEDEKIKFSDERGIAVDYIIIATEASPLISNLRNQSMPWKSCDTLYFTVPEKIISKPLIGLNTAPECFINNIFFHSSLDTTERGSDELLSVTIVKNHDLSEQALVDKVVQELEIQFNIKEVRFIKRYVIPKALPNMSNLQYQIAPSETRLTNSIFLAGDHMLNASLNAAMMSGEMAAMAIIEDINREISKTV